jgi:EAL domain-containing protein (putative c-di-GMP-specific phosphodiesterase class I)
MAIGKIANRRDPMRRLFAAVLPATHRYITTDETANAPLRTTGKMQKPPQPQPPDQAFQYLPELISEMKLGLSRNEFFFVFQPRWNTIAARVSGCEALIRWAHPVRGILEPGCFISVVHDSELATRFTDLLLTSANKQLEKWQHRGHQGLTLSMNISAVEFTKPDLPDRLRSMLADLLVRKNFFQLELTDVVAPDELRVLTQAIRAVQATGVRVALDDFGAGMTSLMLLQQLPVDTLKIAPSLIRNVPDNIESRSMLEKLVSLCHRLGKQVVLEGVETKAQFAWAKTLSHIECQGYYIAMPKREEDMDAVLAQGVLSS